MTFPIETMRKHREKKPRIPRGVGLAIAGVAAILFALYWALSLWTEYLVVDGTPLPSP